MNWIHLVNFTSAKFKRKTNFISSGEFPSSTPFTTFQELKMTITQGWLPNFAEINQKLFLQGPKTLWQVLPVHFSYSNWGWMSGLLQKAWVRAAEALVYWEEIEERWRKKKYIGYWNQDKNDTLAVKRRGWEMNIAGFQSARNSGKKWNLYLHDCLALCRNA